MFEYVNVKVPADTAMCMCWGNEKEILDALFGPSDKVVTSIQTCGSSPFGPYEEGSFHFIDGGKCFVLEYDFMILGDMARIFRYCKVEA